MTESNQLSEKDPMKRKKILLVDDDESLLEIYGVLCEEVGFKVLTAHDGQEALELMQAGSIPHLVFTGIAMPRMSGFELLKKMRLDPALAAIPVAFSSHNGLVEHKKMAQELGATDFIVRGLITPREVLRRLELVLGFAKRFRIAISEKQHDEKALIQFLDGQQGTHCFDDGESEKLLELEAGQGQGDFKIRLIC